MTVFTIILGYINKLYWILYRCFVYPVEYFRYKLYNKVDCLGCIDCYCSDNNKVFGNGKTLSAVMRVYSLYNKYQGKTFIGFDGKPHTNNIIIYSNLDLKGVPFVPLTNLQQITYYIENRQSDDVAFFLIDECNSVMNSRNFKSNLNMDTIKSIVTCRHYNIYMCLVGQRFNYLDAFVRDMCDRVIMCRYSPFLRLLSHYTYNAYDVNMGVQDAKCVAFALQIVKKKYFTYYDTLGEVRSLSYDNSIEDRVRDLSAVNNQTITVKKKGLFKR